MALSPVHARYAQEARAYSLLVLCVATSTLLFVRAVLRPRPGSLIAWAVLSAAAACVHYFAVLVVCAQLASLAFLPDGRRVVRRFLPATGLILVLDLPIALFIARRQGDGRVAFLAVVTLVALGSSYVPDATNGENWRAAPRRRRTAAAPGRGLVRRRGRPSTLRLLRLVHGTTFRPRPHPLTRAGFHEDEAAAFGPAVEVQLWSRNASTREPGR